MKKIILLTSILLGFAYFSQAQNKIEESLTNFEGTWIYAIGLDTFKIVFIRGLYHYSDGTIGQCLIGGYRYVKNGVLIADYTNKIPNVCTMKNIYITDTTLVIRARPYHNSSNEIRIWFKDFAFKKYTANARFVLTENNNCQAHWKLIPGDAPMFLFPGQEPPIVAHHVFSVPTNVIMTKLDCINTSMPEVKDPEIDGGIIKGDEETEGPSKL
ncbi:MAG: DUF6705 family protein [Saezia sp.]